MTWASLAPGSKPESGRTIVLMRDSGHGNPRQVEYFTTDGAWVCPETINGFFYAEVLEVQS